MAWQYFTDWLEPGQQITREQRNELYDAFKERLECLPEASIDLSAIKASPIATDRLPAFTVQGFHGGSQAVAEGFTLAEGIRRLSWAYATEFTGEDDRRGYTQGYGSGSRYYLLEEAAIDLGFSAAEYAAIHQRLINSTSATGTGTNQLHRNRPRLLNAAYWNILRRALQRMRYYMLPAANELLPGTSSWLESYVNQSDLEPTWSAAVAGYETNESKSGSEVGLSGFSSTVPEYRATARRVRLQFGMPTDGKLYPCSLLFLMQNVVSDSEPTVCDATFFTNNRTASYDLLPPSVVYYKYETAQDVPQTNAGIVDIWPKALDGVPGQWDEVEPPSPGESKLIGFLAYQLSATSSHWARMNFTHPYEEI